MPQSVAPTFPLGNVTRPKKLSSKSPLAKAMNYGLKRWATFARFLDDGRICMTNNAAERSVRGIAVGRRNWTFCGSDSGR
jgi:transposase